MAVAKPRDVEGKALSFDELRRLRVFAQGLSGPSDRDVLAAGRSASASDGAEAIASTARRMLAVQGQDWRASRWALGVRTANTTVGDVHEAFNRGLIVRSWPMRGTIHVVAAEDIGWMQSVTNRRVLAGAPKRREFLGITDQTLDRLVEVSLEALRSGEPLDRDQLSTIWTEAGIEWQQNWRYHLIWWLCQNGLAVFGPVSEGGKPRLVAADTWIREPRQLSEDEALAELAARYAAPRGAVTARDFAWWAGLTAGEAKRGLVRAADEGRLVELAIRTEQRPAAAWAAAGALEAAASAEPPEWLLLPAFDEHLLGYQDRAAQLDPANFERVLPGRNGMFLATLVRRGRVVGTWKRGTRSAPELIGTAFPDERVPARSRELQGRASEWARFHGHDAAHLSLAD